MVSPCAVNHVYCFLMLWFIFSLLILLCPAPNRRGIKRCFCLTSVTYIGLSQELRGLGRPKLAQRYPRHTWLGHHFQGQKVKGQGHQAALLTAVLACQAAAVVGVGTCWPWETAATLPSAQLRETLRRPRGRRGAGAYRGGHPPTACLCSNQAGHPSFFV